MLTQLARRVAVAVLFLLSIVPSPLSQAQDSTPGFYVFFSKPSNWSQVNVYTWYVQNGKVVETSGRWPGRALADVSGWYRGFIDQTQTDPLTQEINLIFNSGAAEQTPNLKRRENGWYIWKKQGELLDQWFDMNPNERLYTVTIGNGQGSGRYNPGSLVKIEATPPPPAIFKSWQGQDIALLKDPQQVFSQFQMPERDVVLGVDFEDLSPGQSQYLSLCAKCHGKAAEGGIGPSMQTEAGTCKSCDTDETLQARISSTMPVGGIGRCTGDCAYNVARYIRFGLNKTDAVDCSQLSNRLGSRQLRLLTQREYVNSVRDLFGIANVSAASFWPEPANVLGYNNNAEAALVTDRHLAVFVKAAREIAERTAPIELFRGICKGEMNCTIAQLGLRLFRRPLSDAEIKSYSNLWTSGTSASRSVLEAMLQSPNFLYRSEVGTFVSPMKAFALDNYELAAAMSFTLLGTTPDQLLLDRAAAGSLKDPSIRRLEAERLLASTKARETFGDFASQWLGIGDLPFVSRDQPLFTSRVRTSMLKETELFLGGLVFDQKADVGALFRAAETPLSRELAAYYGLAVPATDWNPVAYDETRRGLLSQGSIHASYANFREASPIKRGVFVRNRLLCQELPPPPANVDTTIPPPTKGLTIRERLERHLSQGQQSDGSNSCASCHQYIDKLGFGFENFDEAARYRAIYAEKPTQAIDVSGELKSPIALSDGAIIPFQNLRELNGVMASSPRVRECVAIQYLRYAQGHQELPGDQCSIQAFGDKLKKDASVRSLLVDFVAADSFLWRN